MKTLGCLTIIVIIAVAIFLFASPPEMTNEQKAQWVGEKAHRGWNQAQKYLGAARSGWQSTGQEPSAEP